MELKETTLSTETLLEGIVFRVERHAVRLGDGSESRRDVVRHAGGVGVLARTPSGEFLLVRQYRKAVEREVVEIVAGLREPGESPAETACRELREETGQQARQLHDLGHCLPSPGYTDEVIHLFFAETDGGTAAGALDTDERLRVEPWRREDLEAAVRENRIDDAKTLLAWYRASGRGLL